MRPVLGGRARRSAELLASPRFWRHRLLTGLAPLTIGLVLASGLVLARGADADLLAVALTVASAIILVRTSVHPLALMAAGARDRPGARAGRRLITGRTTAAQRASVLGVIPDTGRRLLKLPRVAVR